MQKENIYIEIRCKNSIVIKEERLEIGVLLY